MNRYIGIILIVIGVLWTLICIPLYLLSGHCAWLYDNIFGEEGTRHRIIENEYQDFLSGYNSQIDYLGRLLSKNDSTTFEDIESIEERYYALYEFGHRAIWYSHRKGTLFRAIFSILFIGSGIALLQRVKKSNQTVVSTPLRAPRFTP